MRGRRQLRALRREPTAIAALAIASTLLAVAVLLPIFVRTDFAEANLLERLKAPSWLGGSGLLGTDQLGRDLALRIVHGLRTSFGVALLATMVGGLIGTAVGLVAGYFGGRLDALLMRLTDIQMSLPGLLIVMVLVGVFGGGVRSLVIVLGVNSWMLYARVLRAAVLTMRSSDLVVATQGLGAGSTRIILRHILPNNLVPIVAVTALEFSRIMLAEASLSFLGFGVSPPQVSLGAMLAQGRDYLQTSWWIATFSGLFLALTVLSTNLIGSWLQRSSDPVSAMRGGLD